MQEAVKSGDYTSSSEVIREALREWKTRRLLGQMWDDGVASGLCDPGLSMNDIKAEARRRKSLA